MQTGSKNTIVGKFSGNQHGLDIRTSSNNIVLSDGDGNPRVYVNSSGHVAIGTVSPSNHLTVSSGGMSPTARFSRNTDSTSRTVVYFYSDSVAATVGSIGITDSATSYNTSSDHRLKET